MFVQNKEIGEYVVSNDQALICPARVEEMLRAEDWTSWWPDGLFRKTIENSFCYGVYDKAGRQVAFARVVTDFCHTYYLCDVVVDRSLRGRGLGSALLDFLVHDPNIECCSGHLRTGSAAGFYERFGFTMAGKRDMYRERTKVWGE